MKVLKNYYKSDDGKKYDRVTSIIDYFQSPTLIEWKLKVGKKEVARKSKVAKSVGTRVHSLIENLIENKSLRFSSYDNQGVRNCIEGFIRWRNNWSPNILATEKILYSNTYMVAGTADMFIPDQIVDIKTSDRIRPEYWIQLATYAMLYEEMTGHHINYLGILRLDKMTSEDDYQFICNDSRLSDIFICMLNIYRYYNSFKTIRKEKSNDATEESPYRQIEAEFGIQRPKVCNDWSVRDW